MSERAKKTTYLIFCVFAFLVTVTGTALLVGFPIVLNDGRFSLTEILAVTCAAIVCFLVFPLNLVVHELGHVLFGAFCGMKSVSVQIGHFIFNRGKIRFILNSSAGGMSAMLAKNADHLRGKLKFCALGGAVCNFIYGIVFLLLWILLPSPAILFFALFAPLNLYEGLMAIVPAERSGGMTDGAVIAGLAKHKPLAEVMLAVIKVQSVLLKKTYQDIPREWLFDTPVIREDDILFLALTQLRWQYLFRNGDSEGALCEIERLDGLFEYYPDPDLACDLACASALLYADMFRATGYLNAAKGAKGTLSYALASAMISTDNAGDARGKAEREKSAGIRDFALYLLEQAEK